jgi:hypothetical protein
MQRVIFFTRELPDKLPDKLKGCFKSAQKQFVKLQDYCNDEEFVTDFMELNPEKQYSLPLMKQNKIRELLKWLDDHPGKADAILVCSQDHLSPNQNEVRLFRKELIPRRVELISIKPEKLPPVGLTSEHEKVMREYYPHIKKIYDLLKGRKWTGNIVDLRDVTLETLKQDEKICPVLEEMLNEKKFYRFGAKGKAGTASQSERFFWNEIYNSIFEHPHVKLPEVKRTSEKDYIGGFVTKLKAEAKIANNSSLTT